MFKSTTVSAKSWSYEFTLFIQQAVKLSCDMISFQTMPMSLIDFISQLYGFMSLT